MDVCLRQAPPEFGGVLCALSVHHLAPHHDGHGTQWRDPADTPTPREHCAAIMNGLSPNGTLVCDLPPGHARPHRDGDETWNQCRAELLRDDRPALRCESYAGHVTAHRGRSPGETASTWGDSSPGATHVMQPCDSRFHTLLSRRMYHCALDAGHEGDHRSRAPEWSWPDEHAYKLPDGVKCDVDTATKTVTTTTVTHSIALPCDSIQLGALVQAAHLDYCDRTDYDRNAYPPDGAIMLTANVPDPSPPFAGELVATFVVETSGTHH